MPYETDEKLKSFLDSNQLHRERLCLAVLQLDNRFSEERPRHPRGGPDGGRDIEAIFESTQVAFAAVSFVNQGNDSKEQKSSIKKKFSMDLKTAVESEAKPEVFVFMTNINLSVSDKDAMIREAKELGLMVCDVWDRERIRIVLDSPDGYAARYQYLSINLSEAEQSSFFSRWGADIHSVISSGFQSLESALNRVLFLQESFRTLSDLSIRFELDREYEAEEIGHFRSFCHLRLKGPVHRIFSILFGLTDKSGRIRFPADPEKTQQEAGIANGISGGQWERYLDLGTEAEDRDSNVALSDHVLVGNLSGVGIESTRAISIVYSHDRFIRVSPRMKLMDIDEAEYLFYINASLAKKIVSISIFANAYQIQRLTAKDFSVDETPIESPVPAQFSSEELEDKWVRIRTKRSSLFAISFYEWTPKRLFDAKETIPSSQRLERQSRSD